MAIQDLSSSTGRGFVLWWKEITIASSGVGRGTQARGKPALMAGAAALGLYVLCGMSTPAAASYYRHHRAYPFPDISSESNRSHASHRRSGRAETGEAGKREAAKQPSGPLILAISIGSQRVTVYDNGTPVAASTISTGVPGHLTPMGIFSVIQKQRWHHSNLYSNAPMPFMQRITWSGVALHAGVVTGRPASHGCIRLPEGFAVRLWGMTKVGARVIITRGNSAPYEISHARLAGLVKAEGTPDATSLNAPRSPANPGAVVVARTEATSAADAGTEEAQRNSEHSESDADAAASPPPGREGAPAVPHGAAETGPAAEPKTAEPPTVEPSPTAKIDEALRHPGPISLFVSRKLGKLFVRKGFTPVFDAPVTIAHPEMPLGTHVFTASRPVNGDAGVRWLAVSLGYDRVASGAAHGKRKGQAAREERPAPVTGDGLRQAAVDALDRVEFPPEALERIAPLIAPGASLVISDQGLGSETGRDTDFIVVTR